MNNKIYVISYCRPHIEIRWDKGIVISQNFSNPITIPYATIDDFVSKIKLLKEETAND